jgi:hypothetical protein
MLVLSGQGFAIRGKDWKQTGWRVAKQRELGLARAPASSHGDFGDEI